MSIAVNMIAQPPLDERVGVYRPKTEKELLEKIDHSLAQANVGALQDADDALEEIMSELGLKA